MSEAATRSNHNVSVSEDDAVHDECPLKLVIEVVALLAEEVRADDEGHGGDDDGRGHVKHDSGEVPVATVAFLALVATALADPHVTVVVRSTAFADAVDALEDVAAADGLLPAVLVPPDPLDAAGAFERIRGSADALPSLAQGHRVCLGA